jgi:hypothetical protein
MGESGDGEMSVTNQVDTLIKAATSPVNLVSLTTERYMVEC